MMLISRRRNLAPAMADPFVHPPVAAAIVPLLLLAATPAPGQDVAHASVGIAAEPQRPTTSLQITDPRIAGAFDALTGISPTAAAARMAVEAGGLPVAIGTPAQLAALPEADGGFNSEEMQALLSAPSPGNDHRRVPVAWVMFRTLVPDDPEGRADAEKPSGPIERVWIAIEADSVERWIEQSWPDDSAQRIRHDLLAILAHEFVAHVGSIARTRRMDDLCDDPTEADRSGPVRAVRRRESPAADTDAGSCALLVENQVRSELNQALVDLGEPPLPLRHSYSLEALYFENARHRLYPRPAQRLTPLSPMRN